MLSKTKIKSTAIIALGAAFWLTGCMEGGRQVSGETQSPAEDETAFAQKIIAAEKAGLPRPSRPEGTFVPKEGESVDPDSKSGIHSTLVSSEGTYTYQEGQWNLKPLAKTGTSSPWGYVDNGSITALGLVAGGSTASCPSGWTTIPVDLNRRAGGKYIYLCVQSTPQLGVGLEAREIHTYTGGSTYTGTFQLLGGSNGDMNQGAAGAYVYGSSGGMAGLCSTHAIGVWTSNWQGLIPPLGWTKLLAGVDLNSGAGGDFIYLVLKADAVMAVPGRNCANQNSNSFPW